MSGATAPGDGGRDGVIDPDVDRLDATPIRPHDWDLLLAVALGGVLGAEARYGLSLAVPHPGRAWPWSTLIINATGSLLIGVLMVVLLELPTPHRLARPFLGVGVLGGYTTYSTFALDVQRLVLAHRPMVALAYAGATLLAGAAAVGLATVGTQALAARAGAARAGRAP